MMGRGQARQLAPAGLDRETLGADRVGDGFARRRMLR